MTVNESQIDDAQAMSLPDRLVGQSLLRGWRRRCPACGKGKAFDGYLKVKDSCDQCCEELHHQRADDAPPYFTILLVGHTIIPLALTVEMNYQPAYWLQALVWLPLTLAFTLALLPRIKGALVGYQWALRMHGFDPLSEENTSLETE